MRGVHFEGVKSRRQGKLVVVREERRMQTVNELRDICHRDFVGMAVENVECQSDEYASRIVDC